MKYLLFLALCQNGLGTTALNIATPYLLEGPPKATSLQLQLVFACVPREPALRPVSIDTDGVCRD